MSSCCMRYRDPSGQLAFVLRNIPPIVDASDIVRELKREFDGREVLNAVETINISHSQMAFFDVSSELSSLKTVLANNCGIVGINKGSVNFPASLESLDLSGNQISATELPTLLDRLKASANLTRLSLLGNPACNIENYRLVVLSELKALTYLDFQHVTAAERKLVKKFRKSRANL